MFRVSETGALMHTLTEPQWSREWDGVRNLLCVRLDAIGDVLMTGPALRALRANHPERRLTLLTSPYGATIARLMPEVDQIIEYAAPWMKATPQRADAQHEYRMIDALRAQAFDAAVIFTVCTQSPLPAALLCYLAGIPRCLAHCHENPYQLISHWVIDPEPQHVARHEVQRQLDLVTHVGARCSDRNLALRIPSAALCRARDELARAGVVETAPRVVVHPGATAPSRRYPPEHFAAAARLLYQATGCQLVFTGSADERDLIERIRAAADVPSVSLAGRLELAELAATLSLGHLLLVNNTGPAHMAAALGVPVVDLYAQTNLQHTPWEVEHRLLYHEVPCRGCLKSICPQGHHDCLRRVPPERVAAAAEELLRPRMRAGLWPTAVCSLIADVGAPRADLNYGALPPT